MGKIYQKLKAKMKQAYHAVKPYVKSFLHQGANMALEHGKKYALNKASEHAGAMLRTVMPSMARGGLVQAPARIGRVVRLHKGELVIPARKVRGVMRALRKSKIALPISRRV